MSYLGCPRVHWMGLFYTDPANLNNLLSNYSSAELNYDTGLYKYPDGVAQWRLEGCVVTSVVDSDGNLHTDKARDALLGATVETPSPTTPKPNSKGGYHAIGKMADLDPNMQFRSELYGVRLYVEIPGGGGFSGWWPMPPQLRDLYFGRRDAGVEGLQVAVGTWHQRLTDVVWTDPGEGNCSPVYDELKGTGEGRKDLDVKMAVDMFQTKRSDQFSKGDRFGYGRLVASIGLRGEDDPDQLVPGRRLYSAKAFEDNFHAKELSDIADGVSFTRQAGEGKVAALAKSADPPVWNRTDFRVVKCCGRTQLLLDIGGSFPLKIARGEKPGELDFPDGTVVGFLESEGFAPLANGEVHVSYTQLAADTLKLKDCVWPEHAGILSIELTDDESKKINKTPLAMRAGDSGPILLKENSDGIYLNVDTASIRMEPKSEQTVPLYGFKFGQPVSELPDGLRIKSYLSFDTDMPVGNNLKQTKSVDVSVGARGPGGKFPMTVTTGPSISLNEDGDYSLVLRKPLDSVLCFIEATSDNFVVGEAQPGPLPPIPLVTLLFWQNHLVVNDPTWENNIEPLMKLYARLYPGMQSRLDISDLGTITTYKQVLRQRYAESRQDPRFMPVVRDMSPAMIKMMLCFLDSLPDTGS